MNIRQRLQEFADVWGWLPGKLPNMLTASIPYGVDTLLATARLEFHKMRDIDPEDLAPEQIDYMNHFSDLNF